MTYKTRDFMRAPLTTVKFLLIAIVASMFIFGCGSTATLTSQRLAEGISIDGDVQEWGGVVQPVEDQRFALGVSDDGTFLNVLLTSRDQNFSRQIVRSGLIVWLAGDGDKGRTFGIKYPIGLMELNTGLAGQQRRPAAPGSGAGRDEEEIQRAFKASRGLIEVFTEESEWVRLNVSELRGIEVGATMQFGALTYELRIPLQETADYVYGINAGPSIAIGFETPEQDFESLRGQGAGRGGAGGGVPGVGGGGLPSGGGGGVRRGQQQGRLASGLRQVDPIEYWVVVELTKE